MKRKLSLCVFAFLMTACFVGCETEGYVDSLDFEEGIDVDIDDFFERNTSSCKNTLLVSERLKAGQYRCSLDGRFRFGLRTSGDLVLRDSRKILWSAKTCCGTAGLRMQTDGNLVVRDSGKAVWSSKTAGKRGATVTVENNGTAVIRYNGSIIWSVGSPTTNTDECPFDPNKTAPGVCGCGVSDKDSDNDGVPDCKDKCPNDPKKTEPGQCGCGVSESVCVPSTQKVRFFVVGDTQKINNENASKYNTLMERLPGEAAKLGIDFILQTGDITEDGKVSNWERAQTGWRKLDGKVPYVLNVGNNDRMNGNRFSTYFPLSRYKAWKSYVASYESYDNSAHEFSAGGVPWLVVSLRYSDSASWQSWAVNILKAYPQHNVILINHDANTSSTAAKLANDYKNVKFVFAGHTKTSNSGSMRTNKSGGKWVYYKHCWHSRSIDDYFALIELDIGTGVAKGKYYSPYQGKYWSNSSASSYSSRPSWDNWTWNGLSIIK